MFVIVLSLPRVIEMKRMSVNYSFVESFACIRLRLVVLFSLVREELKAV